jgi:N-acetylmuramoyl-L-alanine amidase
MPWHTVRQGDHLPRIAAQYGFSDHKLIFDHPNNQLLKDKKRDPNLLCPGDRVYIPGKDDKQVEVATGKKHRFRVKLTKLSLRVVVHDENDKPFASKPYKLTIDGKEQQGTTNGDGLVEVPVPVDAKEGMLEIEGHEIPIRIGHLDPLEEITGVQSRLANIGYDLGDEHGEVGPKTREALERFQKAVGLSVTGDLDDATRSKLGEKHLC